jgi:hypothetical protein
MTSPDDGYTLIPMEFIDNRSISGGARGLGMWFASHGLDFTASIADMEASSRSSDAGETLDLVGELLRAGYLADEGDGRYSFSFGVTPTEEEKAEATRNYQPVVTFTVSDEDAREIFGDDPAGGS